MLFRRAENTGNPLLRAYFRREARLLRQVEIVSAPRFRIHITCSELDSTRLRAFVPAINVESIPNGVDCDYFRPLPARENENSLVFAGTMNWYPNVDAMKSFINSVWAGLQRNIPSITLDIVGSNPPRSLVTLANAHPGITVHGYVEDVRPYLAAAAIVICPIRDGGGTKLKLLDACAMQKCIVAHPIACEGIDVSDGVDVVLATEPREWIDAISRLLADASTRASFGINARRLVEAQYSYRSIGSRFRSLIEYAANGHGI
jgi:glycosyltransferase involved in cell wall biosynthesis